MASIIGLADKAWSLGKIINPFSDASMSDYRNVGSLTCDGIFMVAGGAAGGKLNATMKAGSQSFIGSLASKTANVPILGKVSGALNKLVNPTTPKVGFISKAKAKINEKINLVTDPIATKISAVKQSIVNKASKVKTTISTEIGYFKQAYKETLKQSEAILSSNGAGQISKLSDNYSKIKKGVDKTKVPIKQNEVTTFKDFVDRSVVGDNLEGHEIWQHANLKANDLATNRLSTEVSRNNPVIALDKKLHKIINKAQKDLNAATQLPRDNIMSNSKILSENGIPIDIVDDITNKALSHMKNTLK